MKSDSSTRDIMGKLSFIDSYELVLPLNKSISSIDARVSIDQYTENDGTIFLNEFVISELPKMWDGLLLEPATSKYNYHNEINFQYSKLFPSLYSVKFPEKIQHESLLRFGMGYDRSWISLVFTADSSIPHIGYSSRCDGLINCFFIRSGSSAILLLNVSDLISLFSIFIAIFVIAKLVFTNTYRHRVHAPLD